MSKSNSIVTDIDRLLVFCDFSFHTRNVAVLYCLRTLEADARELGLSKEQFLEQVVAAKVTKNAITEEVV